MRIVIISLLLLVLAPHPACAQRRVDAHGDPLPEGAVARLGTLRLRHEPGAVQFALSRDGKFLATASAGNPTIRICDPASGKESFLLPGHETNPILGVAFLPGSEALVSWGHDRTARLWDLAPRKERHRFNGGDGTPLALAVSPDGKFLAAGVSDQTLRLWDLAEAKELRRWKTKDHAVTALVFAPDGKTLVTGGNDNVVRLWDVARGQETHRLLAHTGVVGSVAFSPDGKRIATGGADRTVRLWDGESGRLVRELESPATGLAARVVFSPDSRLLATSHDTDELRLWDAATGKPVRSVRGPGYRFGAVGFTPDGKAVVAASHSGVLFFDPATGQEIRPRDGHTGAVHALAYSPDGKTLASTGADRAVLLWDAAGGKLRRRLETDDREVRGLAFSPDGATLAGSSARPGGAIQLWELSGGKLWTLARGEWPAPQGLAFTPDGKALLFSNHARSAPVLDAATGRERFSMDGGAPVVAAACSSDGRIIATAAAIVGDSTMRLHDAATGKEWRRWVAPGVVRRLAFVPGGDALVSMDIVGGISVWATADGRELLRLRGSPWSEPAAAVSPCGRHVAVSDHEAIHLWELATGRRWRVFRTDDLRTYALAFSPDGLTLASAGTGTAVTLWNLACVGDRAADLEKLWTDLGSEDAGAGRAAVASLAADPKRAVALLRGRLKVLSAPPPAETVARLVADLDAAEFRTREKATGQLRQIGYFAEAELRRALAGKPSDEVRRRAEKLLAALRDETYLLSGDALRAVRAVEVLERCATDEARALLETVARGGVGRRESRDAAAALQRLKHRSAGG